MDCKKACQPIVALLLLSLIPSARSGQKVDEQVGSVANPPSLRVQVACMKSTDVTAKDTPERIYASAAQCMKDGNYPDAAKLIHVSGVFWRFDVRRVPDQSAHDAGQMLLLAHIGSLPETLRAPLASELNAFKPGSKVWSAFCDRMREIGPPTYYPSYMVEHGMGAFTSGGGAVVPDFDSAKAWEDVLTGAGHCEPVAAARTSK